MWISWAALVARFRHVAVILDGDEAWRESTLEIAGRLTQKVWVRVVQLSKGKQPDQLEVRGILELLEKPIVRPKPTVGNRLSAV